MIGIQNQNVLPTESNLQTQTQIKIQSASAVNIERQYVKLQSSDQLQYYIGLLQQILLFWYAIMTFFKYTDGDPDHLVTATLGTIPLLPYSIIQLATMILLLLIKLSRIQVQLKRSKVLVGLMIICQILVIIFDIKMWVTGISELAPLIIRPFFLIFESNYGTRVMYKYCRIVYNCLKYIFLMWFLLIIFSSVAVYLFADMTLNEAVVNIFTNLWDAIFNILIMQSTANYPDVGLPYVGVDKSYWIFFIVVMVMMTMLITNIIVATNYNTFKTIAQEEHYSQSIFQLIYQIIKSKMEQTAQKDHCQSLSGFKKGLRQLFQSKIYKGIKNTWLIILFFVICFLRSGQNQSKQAIVLIVMNCFNLLEELFKMYIHKTRYLNYSFSIYHFLCSVIIIILFILRVYGRVSYSTYLGMIFFQLPMMIKFIVGFLMTVSDSVYSFLSKIKEIGFMLFTISLLFAGIGEILWGGMINFQTRDFYAQNGVNPDYVFVNFNNTLNAFATLFALLIVNNWNAISYSFIVLQGNTLPRIYFIFYFTFGVQLSYSLVLSSVIEYIIGQTERLEAIQNYKGTYKDYLNNKDQIQKYWKIIIDSLKIQYNSTHKQIYLRMTEAFTQNYQQQVLLSHTLNQGDSFSMIYYKQGSDQCCLQAATYLSAKKYLSKIMRLNRIINNVKEDNQVWEEILVKELFLQNGINCDDKQKLLRTAKKSLKKNKIQSQNINRIQKLADHLIKLRQYKQPVYINYDLPSDFCQNLTDLYFNDERLAFSFRYKCAQVEMICEKFKISQISHQFGILYEPKQGGINEQDILMSAQNIIQ